MKIYVVTYQQIFDGNDTGIITRAFTTKRQAKKFFDQFVDEERPSCVKDKWEIGPDTSDTFEAYVDGDWPMNHSCAYIHEFDTDNLM
jgi:hypothetical protein